MKQLTTNSTVLEVEIILAIFSVHNRTKLFCRPYLAYKRIYNLAQSSDIILFFQH